MGITVYETYDFKTKKWFWWTGRDKSANCFEIRQNGKTFCIIVNEIFHSSYNTFNECYEKMKAMYDSGDEERTFRILKK